MSPSLIISDSRHAACRTPHGSSYNRVALAIGYHSLDLAYLFNCVRAGGTVFTSRTNNKAQGQCVPVIFAWGGPFQILNAVVMFYTVLMVHFRFVFGVGQKSKRNNSVNRNWIPSSFFFIPQPIKQNYGSITRGYHLGFKESWC